MLEELIMWLWWWKKQTRTSDPKVVLNLWKSQQTEWIQHWFDDAQKAGKPRHLNWMSWQLTTEPECVVETATGTLLLAVTIQVEFVPEPGSPLADVPQATGPRILLVLWRFQGNEVVQKPQHLWNISLQRLLELQVDRYKRLIE